ncbi:MAG: MTAP family purine nucleoside phosphorylase [Thermoplasmata archaeon]|nr:MAG: MTAP family purine nucleoside phosphorylase [Thermoplasmata archaeon]
MKSGHCHKFYKHTLLWDAPNLEGVVTMIGVLGGVGFSQSAIFSSTEVETVETPYGSVHMFLAGRIAFVARHGRAGNVPPHKINHKANISAFKGKGISKVIGVNSVGSLKPEISPPTILIPHDYFNPWDIATIFDDRIVHVVPGLDQALRNDLLSFADILGLGAVEKGVYVQTLGPRLETKAEVRVLKAFGDVVGMTMANEATLAKEMGLGYASICSVDNFAHGITDEPLTNEMILKNARANGERIAEFLLKVVEELE